MNKLKVCKFGGTSVATAASLVLVRDIILADKKRKIIVVSAPGKRFKEDIKVTDLLYKVKNEKDFAVVRGRFEEIINELNLNISLDKEYQTICRDIKNGAGVDYLASRGEYLMAKVAAEFLGFKFWDAAHIISFKQDEGKIITDNLGELIKLSNEGVVIPGFYGTKMVSLQQPFLPVSFSHIKTFQRGGSDITGALLAAAAGAGVYENFTDVDGVFPADPNRLNAGCGTKEKKKTEIKPYKKIRYNTLRKLAANGANVVHPDAIPPVSEAGIKMVVKNTFNKEAKGTVIYG